MRYTTVIVRKAQLPDHYELFKTLYIDYMLYAAVCHHHTINKLHQHAPSTDSALHRPSLT
jgi:hypothetical protein